MFQKKNKKGFIQLLFTPIGLTLFIIAILAALGFGFFAWAFLKDAVMWAVFIALIGGGIYMSVQGNWQPGFALVVVGLLSFVVVGTGMVELSWFGNDGITRDLGVTSDNQAELSVMQIRENKGVTGLVATYIDGEFKRVDYFTTMLTTNYNNARQRSYQNTFDLEQYVSTPGNHTVEFKYKIVAHRDRKQEWDVSEYWRTSCDGYKLTKRSATEFMMDADTKKINKQYLPCTPQKTVGNGENVIPENVLWWHQSGTSFTYEASDLSAEDIQLFADLPSETYPMTIVNQFMTDPVIEPEPTPEPVVEEKSWWDNVVAWFANIKFTV